MCTEVSGKKKDEVLQVIDKAIRTQDRASLESTFITNY